MSERLQVGVIVRTALMHRPDHLFGPAMTVTNLLREKYPETPGTEDWYVVVQFDTPHGRGKSYYRHMDAFGSPDPSWYPDKSWVPRIVVVGFPENFQTDLFA